MMKPVRLKAQNFGLLENINVPLLKRGLVYVG